MKKLFTIILTSLILSTPALAKTDRDSSDYLKDRKHIALMNPLVEKVAEKAIKKSLKKEFGGNFNIELDGYTLSSMKKGIFKNLVITGKNLEVENIEVPYLHLKSITDYNWVDYKKDPIEYKSDMTFAYEMHLTEKSINTALKNKKYDKRLEKVNKIAYPLFTLYDARIRIKHDKVHIIMEYNIPLSPYKRNKTFMVSTGFKVDNNRIYASNVGIDNAYGKIPINKVTNLVNLLDPLTFTLSTMNTDNCYGRVESVKIIDNIIQINGKIYVKKGESK
ncbi:MAG: hypothetical protein E7Z92_00540 [Cyanobacteria bacterium SIG31]|nr:hypothetical protein [Cyanobacteria bacterium SIG31]